MPVALVFASVVGVLMFSRDPAKTHGELSYWFDARCAACVAWYKEPFARLDEIGQVLPDHTGDLPMEDRLWLSGRCGPFACGHDAESLHPISEGGHP